MVVVLFGCLFYLIGIWFVLTFNRRFNGVTLAIFAWGFSLIGSLQIFGTTGHSYTTFVIGLGALSVAAGAFTISILSGFKPYKENLTWILKIPELDVESRLYKLFLTIVTIISILFFVASVYFFVVPGRNFLFSANSRPLLRSLPNAGYFIRSLEIALPFFMAFLGLNNKFFNKRFSLYIMIFYSLVLAVFEFAWGSRGGLLFLLTYIALCYIYITSTQIKQFSQLAFTVVLGIVAFGGINALTRVNVVGSMFESLMNRMFFQQAIGIDYIVNGIFPARLAGWGLLENEFNQVLAFLRIRPYEANLGVAMYADLYRGTILAYNFTTMFIGDAYALAGSMGVAVCSFVLGFFLQSLHINILRGKKSPLVIAFKVYISWAVAMLAVGGSLFSNAITRGLFLIMVVVCVYIVFYFIALPILTR